MNEKTTNWFMIALVAVALVFAVMWVSNANATVTLPKVDICHCESNDCQTLNIAVPAAIAHLQQHDNDYPGQCTEPTPTPSVSPSPTPTPTPEVPEPTPTPSENPIVSPRASSEPTGPSDEVDCANLDALTEEQALNECGQSKVTSTPKPEVTEETKPTPIPAQEMTVFPSTGYNPF